MLLVMLIRKSEFVMPVIETSKNLKKSKKEEIALYLATSQVHCIDEQIILYSRELLQ
jgi:hypothetical protein